MNRTIRPRTEGDDPRPNNCDKITKPCDPENIFIGRSIPDPNDNTKNIIVYPTEEEQKQILDSCCTVGPIVNCNDPGSGLGGQGFKNLTITAYIRNSKLFGKQLTGCAKNIIGRATDIDACKSSIRGQDLIIDLSPPPNPEDKPERGKKYKKGCAAESNLGKPRKVDGVQPVQQKGNFPIRIPLDKIIPPPPANVNDPVPPPPCPLVVPLLNLQIPMKSDCTTRGLEVEFNHFLNTCNRFRPNFSIPDVCGTALGIPCNWTHLYSTNQDPSIKKYYDNNGFLKSQYIPSYIDKKCPSFAKGLLGGTGVGPTNPEGQPLYNSLCTSALSVSGPSAANPYKLGGVRCPNAQYLKLCEWLGCVEEGQNPNDNFIGTDENNQKFDVNTSDISVYLVERGKDTIVSECLNGETIKAHHYTSGVDNIFIDIYFGADCNEENIDDTYRGVAVCRQSSIDCDSYQNYCQAKVWTKEKPKFTSPEDICDGDDHTILAKIFECADLDSTIVQTYLNGPECKPDPVIYCCKFFPALMIGDKNFEIRANELHHQKLSYCCEKGFEIFEKTVNNKTTFYDKEDSTIMCNPKVACCMAPPASPEGTCVYSEPSKVSSTAIFTSYYDLGMLYSVGQLNAVDFTSLVQTQSAISNRCRTAGISETQLYPIEREIGLRGSSNEWLGKGLTNQETQDYYERVLKFIFSDKTIGKTSLNDRVNKFFERKTKTIEKTKSVSVPNCDKNDVIANHYSVVNLTTDEIASELGIENNPTTNNINYLQSLGISINEIIDTTVSGTTPRDLGEASNPRTAILTFKPCDSKEWVLKSVRASTAFKCEQIYKKIDTCCKPKGQGYLFIPDIVNMDLSSNPTNINCKVDAKTGELICADLPDGEPGENKCFVVSDAVVAGTLRNAHHICTEKYNGRFIVSETVEQKLSTKCPDTIDCQAVVPPPEPQPNPDSDPENGLDPDTTKDSNPDPTKPIDPDNPPKPQECVCAYINMRYISTEPKDKSWNLPVRKVKFPIPANKYKPPKFPTGDRIINSATQLNDYLQGYLNTNGRIDANSLDITVTKALNFNESQDTNGEFFIEFKDCDCADTVAPPPNPRAPRPKPRNPSTEPTSTSLAKKKQRLATLEKLIENNTEISKLRRQKFDKFVNDWVNNCTGFFPENAYSCSLRAKDVQKFYEGTWPLPDGFPKQFSSPNPGAVNHRKTLEKQIAEMETLKDEIAAIEAGL